jgi:hypothetical protein
MARIRTIKPEFWDDEKMATIPRDARLLFIGLWNFSDDYGVVKGHPTWIKNKVFPYDDIKQAQFNEWLVTLEKIRAIISFDCNGEKFYYIRTFLDHQRVDKPSQTRNPEAPTDILESNRSLFDEGSPSPPRVLPVVREGKVREGKGKEVDSSKRLFLEDVRLTEGEYQKLITKHGKDPTDKSIEILNNYKKAKGKKYDSDYHAILNWAMGKAKEGQTGGNGNGTHQRVNQYGRPVPRAAWEDDADRVAREYEQAKAAENAAKREAGEEP